MDFATLFSSAAQVLTGTPDLSQVVDTMSNYWFKKRKETRAAFEVLTSAGTLGYAKSLSSTSTGGVDTAIKLTKALIDALIIIQSTKDIKDEQNMKLILGCIDCDKKYVQILKNWFIGIDKADEDVSLIIFQIAAKTHDELTDTMSRITDQWSKKIGGYSRNNNHIL